jgi:hypothetical protein
LGGWPTRPEELGGEPVLQAQLLDRQFLRSDEEISPTSLRNHGRGMRQMEEKRRVHADSLPSNCLKSLEDSVIKLINN